MKLNKFVTSLSVVAMSVLTLASAMPVQAADSSSSSAESSSVTEKKVTAGKTMKAGTYKLEEKNFSHGYKVKMSMTVGNDGKITNTSYDYVDKDGNSKTKDADYEKSMKAKSGVGPAEYIPQLNDSFKKNGSDTGAIAVVSGATESSNDFKNYAQQLVQAAQAGDTKTIVVNNGKKMKNGTYKLAEQNYSHGYRMKMAITVKNGKITKSNMDYVNKNGKSKTKDAAYEKSMKSKVKVGPKEYIPDLNKALKGKTATTYQNVKVVSGATESSNTFKLYSAQLVNAAQNGDKGTIKVSNYVYAE
ncbi:extracellular electron transfer flavoprotein PplA [Loigolactobacillus coryniformis]|jgi:major membrane immunogen (membrane-anchored lipoprotein)|uniref:Sex pheromone cAD1 n=3 Tax=Loigolactobacillus coryniformis TaxID=1610 RepID=J2ZT50_9LACO|nr:extracellular electron transfer flavoprotein PplA [Loigolactobacillus coryniformis]MDT3391218.1 FMN-binding protein [Bacillota bacterium]OEH89805.1 FMN-binding protein [Loigolactobacillus coryniformis subsp. coryniformis]ATO44322.1 FMN-binding protein [Loigolactobacillus coryniformis subsp. torquens DSM 20004 = KCTC 3535]ATO56015.1 FMN-binding protein [Loigolactobacillus coryniformis subsp. coryniformis KCTC 3167 = DSM 20001]EJN56136.1 Sex pheromone cAD1 [Loigolactobacillus coryniformis sub